MKYKLMAVDIDGTLLDSSNNLREETLRAIRQGVGNGLIFTICTGRSIQGVRKLNDAIGLDMPFITYNGAMVVMGKSMEILYEKKMSYNDAKAIYALGENYKTTIIIWNDNTLYVNKLNERTQKYGNLNNIEPILFESVEDIIKNGVTKVLWFDEIDRVEVYEREVGKFLGTGINYYTSMPIFIEFVDASVSKAVGLDRLGERLGVNKSEMIAVGDGSNDIPMIQYAGLGVAMANAKEIVRRSADYITLSNDENGVAHVIEKFVLNKDNGM